MNILSTLARALLFVALLTSAQAQQATLYKVGGVVIDANTGEPLPNCSVSLSESRQAAASRQALAPTNEKSMLTDEQGRFLFEGLPKDRYSLSARKRDYPSKLFEQHELLSTAIVTGPDQQTENIVFRLTPGAIISGSVYDEANEPIRNAIVQLYRHRLTDQDDSSSLQAVNGKPTDDRGRFDFSNISPGRYFLSVSARPWYANYQTQPTVGNPNEPLRPLNPELDVAYPLTYYPNAQDLSQAEEILIKGGEQVEANFTLSPVPALHVRVQLPSTNGRDNGIFPMITRRDPTGNTSSPVQVSMSRSANEIVLNGLSQGDYELSLRRFGEQGPNSTPALLKKEVHLTGNAVIDSDSTPFAAGATVSGKIVFPPDMQFPEHGFVGFQTSARMSRGFSRATIEKDGSFQTTLDPGEYRVFVNNVGRAFLAKLTATGAKATGRTITVGEQANVRLSIAMASEFATVKGFGTQGEKPLSTAWVMIVPAQTGGTEIIRRDQTNSDGSFELGSVLPGRYHLFAIERGWEIDWSSPNAAKPYLEKSILVDLRPGQVLDVKVEVQPR